MKHIRFQFDTMASDNGGGDAPETATAEQTSAAPATEAAAEAGDSDDQDADDE